MLENFGHRVEGTMNHVYEYWKYGYNTPPLQVFLPDTNWDRFTVRLSHSGWTSLVPGCGNVHLPPNSILTNGYDWSRLSFVTSNCEDWVNYPNLTGAIQSFNCSRWSCSDYQFKKWWLSHLPKYRGLALDGKLNNWWHYIYDYEEANAWQQCTGRSTSQICAPSSVDFCAWYLCAYEETGGCFPRDTENTRACRIAVFFVNDLKVLLQNYLTPNDSQFKPVEGKINMLDAGYVSHYLN